MIDDIQDDTYDECTKKDDPEQVRCANCGEAHSAKYRGCSKYTEVKHVLQKVTTLKVSYAQALTSVRKEKTVQTTTVASADVPTIKPKKVMADACTQTETVEISTQTDEPTAFQAKQLTKTADAVLKKTVGIMDESLRRLKATVNGEMINSYPLLETYHSGLGNALTLISNALKDILVILDKTLPATADGQAAKQQLVLRLGTIDATFSDHYNRANAIIAQKQTKPKDTGQPVAT